MTMKNPSSSEKSDSPHRPSSPVIPKSHPGVHSRLFHDEYISAHRRLSLATTDPGRGSGPVKPRHCAQQLVSGQPRDIISTTCPMCALGVPLDRHALGGIRRFPDQVPEPPQLAPLTSEDFYLYFQRLSDV